MNDIEYKYILTSTISIFMLIILKLRLRVDKFKKCHAVGDAGDDWKDLLEIT